MLKMNGDCGVTLFLHWRFSDDAPLPEILEQRIIYISACRRITLENSIRIVVKIVCVCVHNLLYTKCII